MDPKPVSPEEIDTLLSAVRRYEVTSGDETAEASLISDLAELRRRAGDPEFRAAMLEFLVAFEGDLDATHPAVELLQNAREAGNCRWEAHRCTAFAEIFAKNEQSHASLSARLKDTSESFLVSADKRFTHVRLTFAHGDAVNAHAKDAVGFYGFGRWCTVVRVDGHFGADPSLLTSDYDRKEDIVDVVVAERSLQHFASMLPRFFLALHLALPGEYFVRNVAFSDNMGAELPEALSVGGLEFAVDVAERLRWPTLRQLDFDEVLTWLHRLPGWYRRAGTGRTGRAVAALSHLLADSAEPGPTTMMWALLGLEAIYCEGTGGLKDQLLRRSEALLGPRLENKKRFGKMYDYRSRFLHGDLDIPYADAKEIGARAWREHNEEASATASIATAMLIASLQELITRGWNGIEFTESVLPTD